MPSVKTKTFPNLIYMGADGRSIVEEADGYIVYINGSTSLPGVYLSPLYAERALEAYRASERVEAEKRAESPSRRGGRPASSKE